VKRAKKPKPPTATYDLCGTTCMNGIELPWRINTTSNAKGHWRPRARMAQQQRRNARYVLALIGARPKYEPPIVVTLTRIGPRKLDSDNNVSAFKHIRDGVADFLGIDDGSDLIRWEYAQEVESRYAVRIQIQGATP
jgi:hypothetical protein